MPRTPLPSPRWPRLSRKKLILLIVVGGLGTTLLMGALGLVIGVRALGHYFWPLDRLVVRAAPEQPLDFPHPVHMQAGIDCVFCHSTVIEQAAASIPALEQCYFCHKIIGQGRGDTTPLEGIQHLNALSGWDSSKLRFGENPTPINWVRVHRLPDHVQFLHEAHIEFFAERDNVSPSAVCATCHGDVGGMEKVYQERSLKMGDCVDCHREYNAPTDCATCHY